MNIYKLILLPEHNIIVSDEEIKKGDFIITPTTDGKTFFDFTNAEIHKGEYNYASNKFVWKIIAGLPELPSIDYNGLEEKFGIVDVYKLAKLECPDDLAFENMFRRGFQASQHLNNKKFTAEEVLVLLKRAFNCAWAKYDTVEAGLESKDEDTECRWILNSANRPKEFDIEVEDMMIGNSHEYVTQPKITNNLIKILK